MPKCAKCGNKISHLNVRASKDALMMYELADHMLELVALPRMGPEGTMVIGEYPNFSVVTGLQEWAAYAHVGRIFCGFLHEDAHGEGDGSMKATCDRWLRVAKQYCTVGLDRTSTGQRLKGKLSTARFRHQEDSLLAERMSQAALHTQEEFYI